MGYHRTDSMIKDSPDVRERKIVMFWFLYILDKGLCLRLGRASTIRDYDISIPLPGSNPADTDYTGKQMVLFWVKLSGLHSRLYEDLYSPCALREDVYSRAEKATKLASEIEEMWAEHNQLGRIPSSVPDVLELFLLADKIVLSTTLTFILRAILPTKDHAISCSQECVAAARQALQIHQVCAVQYGAMVDKSIVAEYLHWTLLRTSSFQIPYYC